MTNSKLRKRIFYMLSLWIAATVLFIMKVLPCFNSYTLVRTDVLYELHQRASLVNQSSAVKQSWKFESEFSVGNARTESDKSRAEYLTEPDKSRTENLAESVKARTKYSVKSDTEHSAEPDKDITEHLVEPAKARTEYSIESDKARRAILRDVAQKLGIVQTDLFVDYCTPYTPLNMCAETARLKGILKNSTCPTGTMCATEIVKSRLGLEVIVMPRHGEVLLENGVMFQQHQTIDWVDHVQGSQDSAKGGIRNTNLSVNSNLDGQLNAAGSKAEFSELVARVPYVEDVFFEGNVTEEKLAAVRNNSPKIILWYTAPRYAPKISGLKRLEACPKFPCVITSNVKYARNSSAMLFNSAFPIPWLPVQRRHDQVFVYHNQEPTYGPDHLQFNAFRNVAWRGLFNWTMTYRHDSDIPTPYAILRRRRINGDSATGYGAASGSGHSKDYSAILRNKTKIAAAMISNCHTPSRRDDYIRQLQRYIQVDFYGKCGNMSCGRSDNDKCLDDISNQYKFYLGFESAFCEDYITEKFFRYLTGNFVLVVRGSNQYTAHAPGDVFLNAADYKNPRMLAERLKYLDSHPDEYIRMLKAKDDYTSIFEDFALFDKNGGVRFNHYHYENVPFCQMCQRLWNLEKYAKTIPNIKTWFEKKSCLTKYKVLDIYG